MPTKQLVRTREKRTITVPCVLLILCYARSFKHLLSLGLTGAAPFTGPVLLPMSATS